MRNNRLEHFESTLSALLDEADALLESRHGSAFPRHPARPPRGETANPKYDGLFTVEANFSAGIGSRYGAGYTLSVKAATLAKVPAKVHRAWEDEVAELVRRRLPEVFPVRRLALDRDVHGWKLHGDLSLNAPVSEGETP